ncbi:hypothetical protein PC128_g14914 [Phytophthora cactorum]|nr:hypothetical protein PC128_g14914 [Phytophthora cactorum]
MLYTRSYYTRYTHYCPAQGPRFPPTQARPDPPSQRADIQPKARPSLGKARENCSHQSDRRVYNSTHKGRKKEKEINKTEDISCRDAPLS